jgi:hypothetical protein
VSRIVQCGREVFLALAFEFFLCGFEGGHPSSNFFALACEAIVSIFHAHPLILIRVPSPLAPAIEARFGYCRCEIVIVDKECGSL